MTVRILIGDVREKLAELPDESVHCVVTSPPYWGLRDYGVAGQIGLEADFRDYVETMTAVFRDVRRVLRSDGTLWLNLGDCYATGAGRVGQHPGGGAQGERWRGGHEGKHGPVGPMTQANRMRQEGLKAKDLVGMPWHIAFALQADGWWLRRDIIWSKPNPMPESVTDRPTTSHEFVFLLSKSERYWYDAEAVLQSVSPNTHARLSQDVESQIGSFRANGGAKTNGPMKAVGRKSAAPGSGIKNNSSMDAALAIMPEKRNLRSVWTIVTQPFRGAHFATFPPELPELCIKAGCPKGGTVLDPFGGAGTTGLVADRLGRDAVLIELNPAYAEIAQKRIAADAGMFGKVSAA